MHAVLAILLSWWVLEAFGVVFKPFRIGPSRAFRWMGSFVRNLPPLLIALIRSESSHLTKSLSMTIVDADRFLDVIQRAWLLGRPLKYLSRAEPKRLFSLRPSPPPSPLSPHGYFFTLPGAADTSHVPHPLSMTPAPPFPSDGICCCSVKTLPLIVHPNTGICIRNEYPAVCPSPPHECCAAIGSRGHHVDCKH